MSTDRPGFRNSTRLVGAGAVQLEQGLRVFDDRESGERRGVALDANLRVGAANWLELRLYAETIVLRSPQPAAAFDHWAGASDVQAGIKVPIVRGDDLRVTGVLKTSLTTGHPSQSAAGYEPGSEVIFEQGLPRGFAVAGTWNLTRRKAERFVWQHAGCLQWNRSFRRNWSAFVELYGRGVPQERGDKRWVADVALGRTLGPNTIVDAWVGRSVHGLPFWFAAVGLSVRTRGRRP